MRTTIELNSDFAMANLYFCTFSVLFCTLILICVSVSGWARRGSAAAGCRCCRDGAQKSKMDGRWLRVVLRCCSDVVELDLSFQTHIRLSHNSSGQPSCGPDTVLEKFLLFFYKFSAFFGRRGRPLEPDTHTGK